MTNMLKAPRFLHLLWVGPLAAIALLVGCSGSSGCGSNCTVPAIHSPTPSPTPTPTPMPVTITKSFSAGTPLVFSAATLTITITNPNAFPITGVKVSDTLPTVPGQMSVFGTPAATTAGCGAGNFTPAAGATVLNFGDVTTGTIAASSTCTITVQITANFPGAYTNTTGPVMTSFGTFGTATAMITFTALPPTIAKAFSTAVAFAGGGVTLTISIHNPNPFAITGVKVSDPLPSSPGQMHVFSVPASSTSGCGPGGSGNFTPAANDTTLNFGNVTPGAIAAGATCTIKVDVTAPNSGLYTNTTGALMTSFGTFGTATATITFQIIG